VARSKATLLFAAFLVLAVAGNSQAKEWRGITPMKSTKADVTRLFNQCDGPDPSCEFTLYEEQIHIEFSSNATNDLNRCSDRVPPYTVVAVEVEPRTQVSIGAVVTNKRDFKIQQRRALNFSPNVIDLYSGYVDEKHGLIVTTYTEKTRNNGIPEHVVRIDYIAEAKDTALCQNYYDSPEWFIEENVFEDPPPTIGINCPSKKPKAGERITITAWAGQYAKTSPLWSLNAGKIVAGQGTSEITIDTSGLEGQTITVRVRIRDVIASCEVEVMPK